MIGAGITSAPWWNQGWWDVSAKEVKECTLETEGFGTKVEIQIHNMSGDCVEIRSIKIEAISDTAQMANVAEEDDEIETNDESEETYADIIENLDAIVRSLQWKRNRSRRRSRLMKTKR